MCYMFCQDTASSTTGSVADADLRFTQFPDHNDFVTLIKEAQRQAIEGDLYIIVDTPGLKV